MLNSKLDYTSDSQDGPLITGEHMDAGFVAGKPAYVILYGEACYNSKRQARRTVELYNKYKQVRMPNLGLSHDEIAALLGQIEKLSPPAQKTARNLAMP